MPARTSATPGVETIGTPRTRVGDDAPAGPRMPGAGAKVLHVAQPTEAGVPRVVVQYARLQRNDGLEVAVACPPDGDLVEELRSLGIVHLPWPARRSPARGVAAELWRLRRLVRDVEPDVVHLHSSKAGLVGRLVLRGRVHTIFQPHAWSFEAVGGLVGRLSLAWERAAQRWTHATVCVSQAELDGGRDRGVLTDGHVVPNRVDPADWSPLDRDVARSELGLAPDSPLAVCVGRVCEQKGQDALLDVWPAVRAAVPGAELVCVGDGPDHEAWAARRVEGVRFVGADHPLRWYSAADLVVAPSRWEGMALVPLEAQAAGCPVVAHDVTGMREVLHDGGSLVDPTDRRCLADAVVARLSDVDATATLGRRAREAALSRWEAERGRLDVMAAYPATRSTA